MFFLFFFTFGMKLQKNKLKLLLNKRPETCNTNFNKIPSTKTFRFVKTSVIIYSAALPMSWTFFVLVNLWKDYTSVCIVHSVGSFIYFPFQSITGPLLSSANRRGRWFIVPAANKGDPPIALLDGKPRAVVSRMLTSKK